MARFSVESVFRAIDKVSAPVKKMTSRVNKFARVTQRGFRRADRAVNKFGKSLKTLAVVGVAGLLTMGVAVADVTRTGAQFEQTLVSAAAKFPEGIRKGSEAFKELDATAQQLGATTEFTASQVAEGFNFMAMAGLNAKQSIAALPGVLDLATATGLDLARATDIATDSLGAFGLATKDPTKLAENLARVNDVLALTTIRTNTTMEDLFEGIKKGAPAFTSGGQSMESFAALMGVMANSGIKGAEAGTILRNMIVRLGNPVSKATKVMKSLGIEVSDSQGNFRDILDIMADFEKGLGTMGSVQKSAALSTVFGTRSVSGLSVQLKKGTTSIAKFREELKRAEGTNKDLATTMRDTVQGRINSLTSAFEGVKLTIFSLQNTAISGLIEKFTEFTRGVNNAILSNKELANELIGGLLQAGLGIIQVFGLLVGAFIAAKIATTAWGVVVGVVKGAMIAFKVAVIAWNIVMGIATGAMWLFNAAMLANPIGAIIIAIGLVIAAGVLLVKNWDNITSAIKGAVGKIKSAIGTLTAPIDNVVSGFSSILGAGKKLFGSGKKIFGIGGGGDEETPGANKKLFGGGGEATQPQVVTPQQQTAQMIQETRETSSAEVTIKDDTGRAELAQKKPAKGINLQLIQSGAF